MAEEKKPAVTWEEKEMRIIAAFAEIDYRTVRRALVDGVYPRSRAIRKALVATLRKRGHGIADTIEAAP